jgi:hypothetical protein
MDDGYGYESNCYSSRRIRRNIEHNRFCATNRQDTEDWGPRRLLFHVVALYWGRDPLALVWLDHRSDSFESRKRSFHCVCRYLFSSEVHEIKTKSSSHGEETLAYPGKIKQGG